MGTGKKDNVDITAGKNVLDIPISLSNKELIKALDENIDKGDLKLEIDGYANVDLKVSTISIPFKREIKTVKLPDDIKSKLEKLKELGIGFDIRDFKEPTATVDSVEFDNPIMDGINLKECHLIVRLIIDNPNPISIDVKNIEFNIYGDGGEYLGHGVKYIQHIGKLSKTTTQIRVNIKNIKALENIINLTKNDKITIKVSGTATIKENKELGLPEIEIPINRQKEVELPQKLIDLKKRWRDIEIPNPSLPKPEKPTLPKPTSPIINPEPSPTPNPEPVQPKYLYISTYPKDDIKVGNAVTITVLDGNKPVEGAKVTIYDGTIVTSKTTGNLGTVVYVFRNDGTHTIKAEKDGYYPKEISIYVEKLVSISDRTTIVNRLR